MSPSLLRVDIYPGTSHYPKNRGAMHLGMITVFLMRDMVMRDMEQNAGRTSCLCLVLTSARLYYVQKRRNTQQGEAANVQPLTRSLTSAPTRARGLGGRIGRENMRKGEKEKKAHPVQCSGWKNPGWLLATPCWLHPPMAVQWKVRMEKQ